MKTEDILTLARAGFTAAQIAALATLPAPAPAPAPAQAPAPAPVQAPAQAPATDPALEKILGILQQNAINAAQQPALQTTDQILAEIINPPIKREA